ncbi:MAG: hypothetical protein IJZ55_11615 [Lachnospiraceae bacterium]|nr:hypothetical protein [Lachnospiraceae bacterium]
MRRTVGKQVRRVLCAALCGGMLLMNGNVAWAATEAVYEYDVERGESNVYKGVVTTYGLNVRTAAGKDNPVVVVDGEEVKLDKDDAVAILDQAISSGQVWYKVSFLRGEEIVVGYIHSSYVDLTTEKLDPLATPTPVPTPTPTPAPATPTPEATTPTPTTAPDKNTGDDEEGGGGGLVALLVVVTIAAGAVVVWWYMKKRSDDMKGGETSEKLDSLKNMSLSRAPLSKDGTPIPVRKRNDEEDADEDMRRYPVERRDEAEVLADKERARLMNEEMIRQKRNGGNQEEEEKLKEIAANLKEKEVLKEEIDRLRIGDMVYHEYFGKGVVRDNSDVKVIEISFGQDVRFLNKASCAAKRLLRKL